jgi:hypothetical protein
VQEARKNAASRNLELIFLAVFAKLFASFALKKLLTAKTAKKIKQSSQRKSPF